MLVEHLKHMKHTIATHTLCKNKEIDKTDGAMQERCPSMAVRGTTPTPERAPTKKLVWRSRGRQRPSRLAR